MISPLFNEWPEISEILPAEKSDSDSPNHGQIYWISDVCSDVRASLIATLEVGGNPVALVKLVWTSAFSRLLPNQRYLDQFIVQRDVFRRPLYRQLGRPEFWPLKKNALLAIRVVC